MNKPNRSDVIYPVKEGRFGSSSSPLGAGEGDLPLFPTAWLMRFINVSGDDIEEARLGRLFNIIMLVGVASLLTLAVIFAGAVIVEYLPRLHLWAAGIALALAPWPFLYVYFTKRGHVRGAIILYTWSQLAITAVFVWIVDGRYSPGWFFFSWSIMMVGVLIRPRLALGVAGAVVAYYLLVLALGSAGVYWPLVRFDAEARVFYLMTFGFINLVTTSALMTFLTMRSYNRTLARARALTEELETQQHTLQQYVAARSAEVERLARDFSTVAELGRSVSRITDFQTLLNTAASIIARRFEFPYVAIFLLDEERQWLVRVAATLEGEALAADVEVRRRLGEGGLVGYVADVGQLYVALDVTQEPRYIPLELDLDIHFEAGVPLTEQGHVVGVLDVRGIGDSNLTSSEDSGVDLSSELRKGGGGEPLPVSGEAEEEGGISFTDLDRLALQTLADTLSIIIESARRHEETRRTLTRLSEYEQQEAAARWRQLLLKHKGRLAYLYDRVRVARHPAPEEIEEDLPFPLSELYGPYVYDRADNTQVLLVPLRTRNTTVGHLSFEADTAWSDEDIAMVDTVVAQLGLALENARLLEETQRNAYFEQTASTVTARIRAEVEIEAVLQRALEELGQALDVDRGRARLVLADQEEVYDDAG